MIDRVACAHACRTNTAKLLRPAVGHGLMLMGLTGGLCTSTVESVGLAHRFSAHLLRNIAWSIMPHRRQTHYPEEMVSRNTFLATRMSATGRNWQAVAPLRALQLVSAGFGTTV